MRYDRVYNFSAGPAMMPESVLEEIAAEVLNYHGSGMSVMEMSHRSPVFQEILSQAEADLWTLMHIPDNYKVLFIQGGGTVQFAMVPMNLMKNGVACYVETGAWSKKAIAEAKRYGEVKIVASSADKNFSYLPDCSDLDIPDNADYVYICENETINGTAYHTLPDTKGKVLVADQSSLFLSRPCDVSKYGLIPNPSYRCSREWTHDQLFYCIIQTCFQTAGERTVDHDHMQRILHHPLSDIPE